MAQAVRIYHNPRCSKSRGALSILEEKGVDATVIKYLETPPSADELRAILTQLGMSARDLLRKGEAEYKELNLANPDLSDDDIINAMVAHPKLIERPIVISGDTALVARPPERVNDLI